MKIHPRPITMALNQPIGLQLRPRVTAFTTKGDMKAFLKRRRGTLNRPLVYRIDGEGQAPTIMTMSRAMRE